MRHRKTKNGMYSLISGYSYKVKDNHANTTDQRGLVTRRGQGIHTHISEKEK